MVREKFTRFDGELLRRKCVLKNWAEATRNDALFSFKFKVVRTGPSSIYNVAECVHPPHLAAWFSEKYKLTRRKHEELLYNLRKAFREAFKAPFRSTTRPDTSTQAFSFYAGTDPTIKIRRPMLTRKMVENPWGTPKPRPEVVLEVGIVLADGRKIPLTVLHKSRTRNILRFVHDYFQIPYQDLCLIYKGDILPLTIFVGQLENLQNGDEIQLFHRTDDRDAMQEALVGDNKFVNFNIDGRQRNYIFDLQRKTKFTDVVAAYNRKFKVLDVHNFYYQGKYLQHELSLAELGINDNTTIFARWGEDVLSIHFEDLHDRTFFPIPYRRGHAIGRLLRHVAARQAADYNKLVFVCQDTGIVIQETDTPHDLGCEATVISITHLP